MTSQLGIDCHIPKPATAPSAYVFHFSCILLTMVGLCGACVTGLSLPISLWCLVLVSLGCVGLLFLIFYIQQKRRLGSLAILLLTWLLIGFLLRDRLLTGFLMLRGFIGETIAAGNTTQLTVPCFDQYQPQEMTLAFCMILPALSLLLIFAVLKRPNLFLWLLPTTAVLEPLLFYRQYPAVWSFLLLLCSGIMCWSLSVSATPIRKSVGDLRTPGARGAASAVIAVLIAILLTLVFLLVSDTGYATFLSSLPGRTRAQTALTNTLAVTYEEQTPPQGGITGGDFSQTDAFHFTGDTALIAEADHFEGSIYLRGFVGTNYQSDGWSSISSVPDVSAQITETDRLELGNLFHGKPMQLQLTKTEAAADYPFAPYGVLKQKGNSFFCLQTANYDNNLFLLSREDILGSLTEQSALSNGAITSSSLLSLFSEEESVAQQARETCLNVPAEAAPISEEFSPLRGTFERPEHIIKTVMGELNTRAKYTLSPGSTPSGEDFATWFLYENKKGTCTHFATAATLIFRSLGIPARYVEGYVITAKDCAAATQTEDGSYRIEVKDTASHAWCELYLDGYGWAPVEVTPGLTATATGDTASVSGDSIEYETETETKEHEVAVDVPRIAPPPVSAVNADPSGTGQSENRSTSTVPTILLTVLLLLLVPFCIRSVYVHRRTRLLRSPDGTTAVLAWHRFFETVCVKSNEISRLTWAKQADDRWNIPTLPATCTITQKAAYSTKPLTPTEIDTALQCYAACIQREYHCRTSIQKLGWFMQFPLPRKDMPHAKENK